MSKTKLWSLQFSCRRLAREARSLSRSLDQNGSTARAIEQHLATAAQLIAASMEQLGQAPPKSSGGGVLDMAQLAFGDNAWANQSPLTDYRAPHESPPSPQHALAMRAGAQFLATPDLITFLCSMKKTGVLLIDTVDERFTVELESGDIVHAHSDGAPEGERLGDVLVENGVLQQSDLEAMLAEGIRGRFGGRLGARLLDRKLATPDDLLGALETQIRRLFQRLFPASATDFVFWEGPCVWGEQSMRLNATMLLLDGARAIDESSRAAIAAAAAEAAIADAQHALAGADGAAGHASPDGSWLMDRDHGAIAPPSPNAAAPASAEPSSQAPSAESSQPTAVVKPAGESPHTADTTADNTADHTADTTGDTTGDASAVHPPHPLSPTPARAETEDAANEPSVGSSGLGAPPLREAALPPPLPASGTAPPSPGEDQPVADPAAGTDDRS